ncbi:MAG: S8 family serine peptidase, partial [Acidimicrobiia bacterium]
MPTNTDSIRFRFRGVGWGDDEKDSKGRPIRVAVLAAVLAMLASLVPLSAAGADEDVASWIVRGVPGKSQAIAALLAESGVTTVSPLPIIDGFVAEMTPSVAARVGAAPDVAGVTPDARIELSSFESGPPEDGGSLYRIVDHVLGVDTFWESGFTGEGVDVAIIDSGISPVAGLDHESRVVNGPDISFDSLHPNLQHLDLFGHGTHMASIIAGSDLDPGAQPGQPDFRTSYMGIAPNARLVNVKVADARGLADVSQVIAALDWIVAHKNDPTHDLDVRVLGLAFGTDSNQSPAVDPLAYAVEQAWNAGIVVVVSSGNDGNDQPLRNQARHPSVIAVGGVDTRGTHGTGDDRVLEFSNCGTDGRTVDLVAPGKSILGLRVPGSYVDTHHGSAVVQDRLFRGSGTSQASAIVAGAAALIVDQRPDITPDEVKALLRSTARPLKKVSAECQGAGLIDLDSAFSAATPSVAPAGPYSDGTGSLDEARGSHQLVHDGVTLEGDVDIFGDDWTGSTDTFFDGASWSGASWSGASWSGASWSGASWSGASWSGASW